MTATPIAGRARAVTGARRPSTLRTYAVANKLTLAPMLGRGAGGATDGVIMRYAHVAGAYRNSLRDVSGFGRSS